MSSVFFQYKRNHLQEILCVQPVSTESTESTVSTVSTVSTEEGTVYAIVPSFVKSQ